MSKEQLLSQGALVLCKRRAGISADLAPLIPAQAVGLGLFQVSWEDKSGLRGGRGIAAGGKTSLRL